MLLPLWMSLLLLLLPLRLLPLFLPRRWVFPLHEPGPPAEPSRILEKVFLEFCYEFLLFHLVGDDFRIGEIQNADFGAGAAQPIRQRRPVENVVVSRPRSTPGRRVIVDAAAAAAVVFIVLPTNARAIRRRGSLETNAEGFPRVARTVGGRRVRLSL